MTRCVIDALNVCRAGLPVVHDAHLLIESGRITVVLGANGAGKTTLLEGIGGVLPVAGGRILLDGQALQNARPEARARAGLGYVEQGRAVFGELSTEENLRVGLRGKRSLDPAYDLFPQLRQRRSVRAGLLSGGEQQMLVIARALLCGPSVLLVDEMSAGLAPIVVQRLMQAMRRLADQGLAILLVEQYAELALAIGDHVHVMRRGAMVFEGPCTQLRGDAERLHALYLGAA